MNTIPILQKAIDIIHEIAADEGGGLAAKHLSLSLGIAPATTYRILRTLAGNDWLRETRRGEFQLAFGLARVTRSYARVEHALSLLRRPLRELTERTGLSAKVSIREGMQVVTALRAESRRPNSISSPIGSRMHLLDSGSVGVSLMARLPKNEVMRILKSTTNAGVAEELVLRKSPPPKRPVTAARLARAIRDSRNVGRPAIDRFGVRRADHCGVAGGFFGRTPATRMPARTQGLRRANADGAKGRWRIFGLSIAVLISSAFSRKLQPSPIW